MKKLAFLVALSTFAIAFIVWNWDGSPPVISWGVLPEAIGAGSKVALTATDSGNGIAEIEVIVEQGGQRRTLLSEGIDRSGFLWGRGTAERSLALVPGEMAADLLQEGEFTIEARVRDHADLFFFNHSVSDKKSLRFDKTPPNIAPVQAGLNVSQGGAELVLFRSSESLSDAAVAVGDNLRFKGFAVPGSPGLYACLFALPYDRSPSAAFQLSARDEAGNEASFLLPVRVDAQRPRRRRITISQAFIDSAVASILTQSGAAMPADPVEAFLEVNSRMRRRNHEQIAELSKGTASELLIREPFVQLSNSAVQAYFADERTYVFQGKEIDRQTHLGFDLASVAQAPVEAANRGRILYADRLGIYGNAVLIDHGWGLVSLYAHLTDFAVAVGDEVARGQTLGRTGQTGLAAGDHLHFSVFVQGVAVDPLEWWDKKWIDNHLLNKIAG